MAVTAERKDLVSQLVRFSVAEDLTVQARNPRAVVDERVSPLDLEVDADVISAELLALFGFSRTAKPGVYGFEAVGQQYVREVGDTITVDFSEFGLPKIDAIIISVRENSKSLSTSFEVFI